MIQLEVAVVAPVRQSYTYSLSNGPGSNWPLLPADLIGRRVFVPFGNRRITGYILDIIDKAETEFEIKEILDVLDDVPLFHADMVPLFRWISRYYHYPLGNVIKTALPAGLTISSSKRIRLTNKECFEAFLSERGQGREVEWSAELHAKQVLSPAKSKKILGSTFNRKIIKLLVEQKALIVEDTVTKERVSKKLEICYRINHHLLPELIKKGAESPDNAGEPSLTVSSQEDEDNLFSRSEMKTLSFLEDFSRRNRCTDIPRKELTRYYPYGSKIIKKLLEKGVVQSLLKRIYRSPLGDMLPHHDKPKILTDEQLDAVDEIQSAQKKKLFRTFLLHGVTGSGKTEVYLQAALLALQMGRGVLVLVPEIALATQIESHFVSRFGDKVALLHSGLTQGERYDEWHRINSGEAKIVIGARSAVFAPLSDLGLIIVDEEHDASFKQEDGLRYNGRDVAIVRARNKDAVVVLGSATPAVTSFHHGSKGKYRLLKLHNRVGGKSLPTVSIVDLRKKSKETGRGLFHQLLRDSLEENYLKKQQTILLLNRRGFSTSVICQDCGALVECSHCNVTMNYHKHKKVLLCHYCGYKLPVTTHCPTCRSSALKPIGFGTERVVEEVKDLLPEARIARLDSDISTDRKKFLSILQSVRQGDIDILVGTQLIAKGLHFPNVTFVGVVFADSGLAFPDYRSAEKTYQLIAQVTGRAGRGEFPGKVVIQSMHPEHYAIRLAAQHRYDDLAEQEIEIRRQAGFPPFVRLAAIRVENSNEQRARNGALAISTEARSWCHHNRHDSVVTILGPAPAPIEKIRDYYRWHVLLKSSQIDILHQLIDHIDERFQANAGERITIDIDPENML